MNGAAHVVREGLHDEWDAGLTLREARAEYFRFNGFGDDGGYSDAWVDFKLGPIPFPFPNSAARVKALKYHDLHHVITGYQTDFLGELEIAAWELGSDCSNFVVPLVLNMSGLATGMVLSPKRIFSAYVRGRRTKNLYQRTYDDTLLSRTIAEVRDELHLNDAMSPATLSDKAAAAAWTVAGAVVGTALFLALLPLAPIGYAAGHAFKPSAT